MSQLKVGDKAPDFKMQNQNDETVSLSDYKGRKLILYFYPKDDTPGCTKEACSLRDSFDDLRKIGFEVLGVSPDKVQKHKKFIDKYDLPFDLGVDENHEVLNAYDAWGWKKFMGREYEGVLRKTYLIDENGVITHIFDKVRTKDHAVQIMEELILAD